MEFSGLDNLETEQKLMYYFKNKKIYIEIYNDDTNISYVYFNKLEKYKISKCKKLCKSIDYIVFKDGHLKTKKYAILNNITIVNPIWIDDKITKNIFKEDKCYEIIINYDQIILSEKIDKLEKEEKKNLSDKKKTINYNVEIEAEFDSEYANLIDKMRSNSNSNNKDLENTIKREKRKCLTQAEDINNKDKNKTIKKIENKPKLRIKDLLKNKKIINNKNQSNSLENYFFINKKEDNGKVGLLNNNNANNKKINLYSYRLTQKEIDVLINYYLFNYEKDIFYFKKEINYTNIEYIIIDLNKEKYNWEIYKYILDNKIVIDISAFLLEFVNEDNYTKHNNLNNILKAISINNEIECVIKNKKINKKINETIFKNNIKNKSILNINNPTSDFQFAISKLLDINEKKILLKILKILNGKVISKKYKLKRSLSYEKRNNIKKENIGFFRNGIFNSFNTKNDYKSKFIRINKYKLKNNLFLISNEFPITFYFDIDQISFIYILPSYIYDSYFNGELLDLQNIKILNKYILLQKIN